MLEQGAEWNVVHTREEVCRTCRELRVAVETVRAAQIVSAVFYCDMQHVLWKQVLTFRGNLLAHPSWYKNGI